MHCPNSPPPPVRALSLAPTQYHLAGHYDNEVPLVRLLLEDAREAHWKLTAPKGFAALKVGGL